MGPIATIVSGFLSLFTAPFLVGGPTAPAGPVNSLLEFFWAARRQVQSFLFNALPTAQPFQVAQTVPGTVTGSLGALDTDGDPLLYSVTRGPTNGTVVVDDLGNYTYTPGATLSATGGVDTFDVGVSDATSFHFHGLGDVLTFGGLLNRILGLPDPNVVRRTVTVTVAAPNSATTTVGVGEKPEGVALSADGSRAYVTNSGDNSVSVIDTSTNTVIATITDVGNTPVAAVVDSGTKLYVVNQFDDSVAVIDTSTNSVAATIAVGSTPQAAALSADGTRLYVANAQGGTVSVIDTATNTVTSTITVGVSPQGIAASPDGTRLYVTNSLGSLGGSVSVIDTATGRVASTIAVASPQAVAVGPDGKVYVTGFDTSDVSVLDPVTNAVVATIHVGGNPDAVAVSSDGTKLFVSNSQDGTVSVVDTATNLAFGTIDVGFTGQSLAISPGGTKLYVPDVNDDALAVIAVNPDAGSPPGTQPLPIASIDQEDVGGYQDVQTYTVTNLTNETVTFIGYHNPPSDRPSVGPAQYTKIPPGGSVNFTLGSETTHLNPTFGSGDIPYGVGNPPDLSGDLSNLEGGPDYAYFAVELTHEKATDDGSNGVRTRCQGAGGAGRCSGIGDTSAILLPPKGSVVDVPAVNQEVQSGILNSLCRDSSNCDYTVTSSGMTTTAGKVVGAPIINGTNPPTVVTTTLLASDTESHEISVTLGVKAGGTIAGIVNTEFTATFGYKWTTTHTFSQSITLMVPPGYTGYIVATAPVFRITGNFSVRFLDVTFNLYDVYLDAPNPNGTGSFEPMYKLNGT